MSWTTATLAAAPVGLDEIEADEWDVITDEAALVLPRFGRLQMLALHRTRITDAAMPSIGSLTTLRHLSIIGSPIWTTPRSPTRGPGTLPSCRH